MATRLGTTIASIRVVWECSMARGGLARRFGVNDMELLGNVSTLLCLVWHCRYQTVSVCILVPTRTHGVE